MRRKPTQTAIPPLPDTAFWRYYQGSFKGILRWPDMDCFWAGLRAAPDGWYLFDPDDEAPLAPLSKAGFIAFLPKAEALINSRRDRSVSGAVYVDDLHSPGFAKIFDPVNMGSACSISTARVMPRWILSHIAPDTLPKEPAEAQKDGILSRLTGYVARR